MCEFVYDDLCLKILIEAVQDRISNDNIDDKIEAFLYDNAICDGLTKESY